MSAKLDYPGFEQPLNNAIKIWRYMDLAKFVSLISTGHLYFPRASTLLDKYEGSIPRANKNNDEENGNSTFKGDQKYMRERVHISCWYASEYESEAMWQIYSRSGQGLAIQSSYSKLAELLPYCEESPPIYLGKVSYINYEKESISKDDDSLLLFTYKREAFEHEKEVRAIFELPKDVQHDMDGRPVKIAVNDLIEKIYLAPGSPDWFADVVYSVKNKYEIDAKIDRSSLDAFEPFYGVEKRYT